MNYKILADRLITERALKEKRITFGWGKCPVRVFTKASRRCNYCNRIGAQTSGVCPASNTPNSRLGLCVLCRSIEHRTKGCTTKKEDLKSADCHVASTEVSPIDIHHRLGTKECPHYRRLFAVAKKVWHKRKKEKGWNKRKVEIYQLPQDRD